MIKRKKLNNILYFFVVFLAGMASFFYPSPVSAEIVVFSSSNTRCRPVSLNENISITRAGGTGAGCEFSVTLQAQGEWALTGGYYDTPPYGWGGSYPFLIDERAGYIDPGGDTSKEALKQYRNYSFTCSQPSYTLSGLPSYVSLVRAEDIAGSVPALANSRKYTFRVNTNAVAGNSFSLQGGFTANCNMESEAGLQPVTYTRRCQDQSPININPRQASYSYNISISSTSCISPTPTRTPTPRPFSCGICASNPSAGMNLISQCIFNPSGSGCSGADINGSGTIDSGDLAACSQCAPAPTATPTPVPPPLTCGICATNPSAGMSLVSQCVFNPSGSGCANADINGDGRITAGDLTACGFCAPPPTATPVPPASCGQMCDDYRSCVSGTVCVREGAGYTGMCGFADASVLIRCGRDRNYTNCCTYPATPTPTYTPIPTATFTPTPTPVEWYKLKDSSFHKRTAAPISIPWSIRPYDRDDNGASYPLIGAAGVFTGEAALSVNSFTSEVSSKNWARSNFADDNSFLADLSQYVAYKKSTALVNSITSLSQAQSNKLNIFESDVTINQTNTIPENLTNAVIMVQGNLTLADMPGNNDLFNPEGSSLAFVVTGNLQIHSDYTELQGIFIANAVNLGYNAYASSVKHTTPLKISGNLISATPMSDLRRARSDYSMPTVFIVMKPKMYIDLLPYIGHIIRESRQIE